VPKRSQAAATATAASVRTPCTSWRNPTREIRTTRRAARDETVLFFCWAGNILIYCIICINWYVYLYLLYLDIIVYI
jgi:hypothetical protein